MNEELEREVNSLLNGPTRYGHQGMPDVTQPYNRLFNHQLAMTEEGLHDEVAIASELAYRDELIEKLQTALKSALKQNR